MKGSSLSNFYTWAIKVLIFIIPFLSLWIASSLFFPYITPRNFTFRILIEVALILWLALIFLSKEYRPRITPIVTVIAIFLAVVGLADLLGVNSYKSFWSSFERMEGYISLLHLGAYFVILTTVFKKRDWLIFFNLFIIAGLFAGFYGLSQKFSLFGVGESIQGGERIDGTIGNPTYFAAYLILVLILAAILFFKSQSKETKFYYLVAAAFFSWVIYLTATRGAILSLIIGLPLFLLLYLIFIRAGTDREKLVKKVFAAILILIVIAPVIIFLLRDSAFVKNSFILSRLSFSIETKPVEARLLLWKVTWQGIKERPILGWGQENFIQVFSKHYNPQLYKQEPWFDRAHNIILDWLINAGILGLLAYLGLFGATFYVLYRLIKNNYLGIKEGLIIFTGLVVYFIQNLFVFDNFNTYVIFFALLAYINSHRQSSFDQNQIIAPFNKKLIRSSFIALTIALIGFSFLIYFVNFRPLKQSLSVIEAFKASSQPKDTVENTLKVFKSALSQKSFGRAEVLEQFLRMATTILTATQLPESPRLEFVVEAVNAAENYLKKFPQDIRMRLLIASLYNRLGIGLTLEPQKIELLSRANKHILAAIDLSPTRQDIYSLLAENYFYQGDEKEALEALKKGAAIFPDNGNAQINLAVMAILTGEEEIIDEPLEILKGIYIEQLKNPGIDAKTDYQNSLARIYGVCQKLNCKKLKLMEELLKEIQY